MESLFLFVPIFFTEKLYNKWCLLMQLFIIIFGGIKIMNNMPDTDIELILRKVGPAIAVLSSFPLSAFLQNFSLVFSGIW